MGDTGRRSDVAGAGVMSGILFCGVAMGVDSVCGVAWTIGSTMGVTAMAGSIISVAGAATGVTGTMVSSTGVTGSNIGASANASATYSGAGSFFTGGVNDNGAGATFSVNTGASATRIPVGAGVAGTDGILKSIGLNAISSSKMFGSVSNNGFTSSSAISSAFGSGVVISVNLGTTVATGVGRTTTKSVDWSKMTWAASASAMAASRRRCAFCRRFFERRNFSLVASICASVRKILDADCLVGSRPTFLRSADNLARNPRNLAFNSAMVSLVRSMVSRALSAVSFAAARRSVAARRIDAVRNADNSAMASVISAPSRYALIRRSYAASPLYSISSF